MDTKHTPGPWVAELSVDEHGLSVIASDEPDMISNPSRGQVCHISTVIGASGVGIPDHAEAAKANARLIASAPEMLEAISDIRWASADRDNMEFEARITYVQMDAIRAAIAKATGQ